MKRTLFLFFACIQLGVFAQTKDVFYTVGLHGALSSDENLPFHFRSNDYGRFPSENFGALEFGVLSPFQNVESKLDYSFGATGFGFFSNESDFLIDEIYVSGRWGEFVLDAGIKHKAIKYNGLSISNGSFSESLNARSVPGINVSTVDYIILNSWFAIKGNYSEYWMNDPRAVDGVHLHNKSIHFRFYPLENWSFNFGLDHYAQWAGTSPRFGKQPATFNDYLRIVFAQKGSDSANESDQANVLGNHLGSQLFEVNYQGDKTNVSLYWSHHFEDNSGLSLKNWQDGLFGVYVEFSDSGIFKDVLIEYVNSRNQGLSKSTIGHPDKFFNNDTYESGWTFYGQTIGLSYILPVDAEENGITNGVDFDTSRLNGFNLGTSFIIGDLGMRFKLSGIYYEGWFGEEFNPKPTFYSFRYDVNFDHFTQKWFQSELSLGYDTGSFVDNSFGVFVKLFKTGLF